MIENDIEYRLRKVQGGVLSQSHTSISDSERENWVRLNMPVALMSGVNGVDGVLRVGQIVHAIEVRLKHDEVRLQESTEIQGLSFNFDLADDPEASGRRPSLLSGTKIRTFRPHSPDSDWSKEVQLTRRWGVRGKIMGYHHSRALYYDVLHEDGTSSSYYPTELA